MPPTPHLGWTGGQYSLVRGILGLALLAGFAAELAHRPSIERTGHPAVAITGATCAVLLVFGVTGRSASAALLAILAQRAFAGVAHPSPLFSLPLALHLAVPPAPFLSWPARGRIDPAGSWVAPHRAFAVYRWLAALASALPLAWMLAVEELRGGIAPVGWEPLCLTSAFGGGLLAVSRRPGIGWLIVAFTLPLAIAAGGAPHHALAAAVALLFTVDPAWIAPVVDAPVGGSDSPLVFYDGHCGLCHSSVRLCLAEDARGAILFSPLGSHAFTARLTEATRTALPDSLVLVLPGGRHATRSTAAVWLLVRLGGLWRVLGHALWAVPRPLRNLGYRAIASIRNGLFARPSESCPILPPAYRDRFLG